MINNQQKMFNGINKKGKGFTLLELLIVIAILAILSVVTVLVLNPAETLRKARDVQRISDLDILKTALGLYLTTKTSPNLTNDGTPNDRCIAATASGTAPAVFISVISGTAGWTPGTILKGAGADAETLGASVFASQTAANVNLVSGAGWLPVNFDDITGGSPISNLPRDPNQVVNSAGEGQTNNHFYTYVCNSSDLTFELNANLESAAFSASTSADNKENSDGGDNNLIFEKGTKLTIVASAGF